MSVTFSRRYLTPYLFLLPALFILSLTVLWPAVQAFYLSFTNYEYDLTQIPQWVGLKNFYRLWGDRTFWQTLTNTLLYLTCVVPVLVVVPLGMAILCNQKLKRDELVSSSILHAGGDFNGCRRDCLEVAVC